MSTSYDFPKGTSFLSIETRRYRVDGVNVREIALVKDDLPPLVDLSIKTEKEEDGTSEHPTDEDVRGVVSAKEASEAVRSHLTSDVVLISSSSLGAMTTLGLEEGKDYRSHVSLIDAFTVTCKHCRSVKSPSQKRLHSLIASLWPDEEMRTAAENAMGNLRLFRHYLKIKDDNKAWEAVMQRLFNFEASQDAHDASGSRADPSKTPSPQPQTAATTSVDPQSSSKQQARDRRSGTGPVGRRSGLSLFSIDAEFVLLESNRRSVGQVALVDDCGKVLLNVFIKQKKPVIKYGTSVNGLTKAILESKGISFYKALTTLKHRLPRNAIVVGLGIDQDMARLTLKRGVDFRSAVDLGDIFKSFTCPLCRRSNRPSLDHLSAALLGMKMDGRAHDAADDARRSMEIYRKYLSVKDSPKGVKELKKSINRTPKPPKPGGGLADHDGV